MIKQIVSKNNKVELGMLEKSSFNTLLDTRYKNSKKIVIVDENTQEKCWPYLLTTFESLKEAEVIVLPSGEENKVLEVCFQVWEALSNYQIQRSDLIINLGGGVVTDMGGFIASVFKRGLDFINIPTTLLAMVDASVGGKTGVNLGSFKNQLGVFSLPELTVCDPTFLKTLENKEILAGKAEMIKHGLITSKSYVASLETAETDIPHLDLIAEAVQIKAAIVDRDFQEKGERKTLNFGHTIGHGIEGFLMTQEVAVTHGECVAWGMLVESYLSNEIAGLSEKELDKIETLIRKIYPELPIQKSDFDTLIKLMRHDKKNKGKHINFTLLNAIGSSTIDYNVDEDKIMEVLTKVFEA
ncbi:3-dehydroquinate synthase [Brumimicrobium salinarum]|uniref:3-dehydroquinate synthase n=1 Tax=Brumimicrobium salinarum TaxID=2058658 RepID=A0A2I0R321_9FLAO|nr:3-dehydroquinate synthase [Brumimicrobium salinarum]PKR80967.1 3-dehydroquinate synthase [Brumimicrobium salinarum]